MLPVKGESMLQTLSQVPIGHSVMVNSLHLNSKTALRLQSLGMIPGTRVSVLQSKGHGTMILDVRGTRFALGPAITQHVEVCDEQ